MRKLTIVALLVLSSNLNANVIRWELRDVNFDDGGTARGFFEFDSNAGIYYPFLNAHSGKVYEFDFEISGGAQPAFDYTPETAYLSSNGYGLRFSSDAVRSLYFGLSHSPVAAGQVLPNGPIGATYQIDTSDYQHLMAKESLSYDPFVERYVKRGAYLLATASSPSIDPIVFPEPGTWAAMLTGFGLLGWCMKRKAAARVRDDYLWRRK